jgi:hypothetical protein
MKVFKFLPPYKMGGRTNFPQIKKRTGVYLIKENGKITYVGQSGSDLYKTLYRHFQFWSDREYKNGRAIPAQYRVSYQSRLKRNKYTVRVIYCTAAQAVKLERYLIKKINPRDNEVKYEQYQINYQDNAAYESYTAAEVDDCPF